MSHPSAKLGLGMRRRIASKSAGRPSSIRFARFLAVCIGGAILGGCATYQPAPLEPGAALGPPIISAITRDSASVERPWLTSETVDLTQPLDGNGIAILTVLANPDLKALRARAGVADAQAFAAGLLPDPTFSFGVSPVISGPDSMIDLAGALGFDLNALRTRGVVRRQARAEARRVRLDLAWSEWQTAGEARLQAARLISLDTAVVLARQSLASTQSLLDRSLRAAGRGDLSGDQVQAARIAAYDAAERLRRFETEMAAARFELTRLIGLPPGFVLRLAETPVPPQPPNAETLLDIALENRADLQALRAGYEAQEAAVHKAVLDQFPNLVIALHGNRDTGGNLIVGPSVDLTLPLWNRNRGGIAVGRATRTALSTEYQARIFQTRANIAAAVANLTLIRQQLERTLADLPQLRRFANATRSAATRGDLALATAEVAEQAVRDRETTIAQINQSLREQTIALELLTGSPRESWPQ